jgi:hypothetical protein
MKKFNFFYLKNDKFFINYDNIYINSTDNDNNIDKFNGISVKKIKKFEKNLSLDFDFDLKNEEKDIKNKDNNIKYLKENYCNNNSFDDDNNNYNNKGKTHYKISNSNLNLFDSLSLSLFDRKLKTFNNSVEVNYYRIDKTFELKEKKKIKNSIKYGISNTEPNIVSYKDQDEEKQIKLFDNNYNNYDSINSSFNFDFENNNSNPYPNPFMKINDKKKSNKDHNKYYDDKENENKNLNEKENSQINLKSLYKKDNNNNTNTKRKSKIRKNSNSFLNLNSEKENKSKNKSKSKSKSISKNLREIKEKPTFLFDKENSEDKKTSNLELYFSIDELIYILMIFSLEKLECYTEFIVKETDTLKGIYLELSEKEREDFFRRIHRLEISMYIITKEISIKKKFFNMSKTNFKKFKKIKIKKSFSDSNLNNKNNFGFFVELMMSRIMQLEYKYHKLEKFLNMIKENYHIIIEDNVEKGNIKLNSMIKVLTILSTIYTPMNIIPGLLGMNVKIPFDKKLIDNYNPFIIICLILIALLFLQLYIFKKLKWF